MDSTWEVKLAQFLDEENIKWDRPKIGIPWQDSKGKTRRYYPDFYIPILNLYVDPKNPISMKQQKEKLVNVGQQVRLVAGDINAIIAFIERGDRDHVLYISPLVD